MTSAKISDGTIVNADVNSSAAIAGTKVSPNFGSQNVTTTGDGTFDSVAVDDVIYGIGGTLGVDSDISANGLRISPSDVSGDSATIGTTPSETCDGSNQGAYEIVDDTNAAGVWLWVCEQTGTTTYVWGRIN